MKISQPTIFRQKALLARNSDPATTQVAQSTLQQEQKKPKKEAPSLACQLIEGIFWWGVVDLLFSGLGELLSNKSRK